MCGVLGSISSIAWREGRGEEKEEEGRSLGRKTQKSLASYAAKTGYCRLGSLNNRNVASRVSEGWKAPKPWQRGHFLVGGPLSGLQMAGLLIQSSHGWEEAKLSGVSP